MNSGIDRTSKPADQSKEMAAMEISELAGALVALVNLLEADWRTRREARPEVADELHELRIRAEGLFGRSDQA